ncbi:MAG: hypothetical protein M5U11_00605 [Anaerolineales bacterium]|nr:hypothetical protein [Anaerolineales bacterium]
MYAWTQPYEDEYVKERIAELNQAQANAARNGKILVAPYEQFWLPVLNDLPEVEYIGRQTHRARMEPLSRAADMPFHGALWFTPNPGADLPPALKNSKDWLAGGAVVDMNARSVKILAEEIEITFTGIDVSRNAHQLIEELNRELVRANAGVYLYWIEPAVQPSTIKHLYPDGRVPTLSNAHTRADVTGLRRPADRPNQHMLAYVGVAAHKTSVESLWASLIRGRGGCSLRGASILADGEIKMVTQALVDFSLLHAGLICRKALPGKWEAKDDAAYALVFEDEEETNLQTVTLKRLQETLAFPIPDTWAKTLWEYALEAEFIQRLETGGDCLGGVRIDLTRDWQALVQNLLEQGVLKV